MVEEDISGVRNFFGFFFLSSTRKAEDWEREKVIVNKERSREKGEIARKDAFILLSTPNLICLSSQDLS